MELGKLTGSEVGALAGLLRRRREIIADHVWRDRDGGGHLAALQGISEQISAATAELKGRLPARLDHFLHQCSFDKALAFIEEGGR